MFPTFSQDILNLKRNEEITFLRFSLNRSAYKILIFAIARTGTAAAPKSPFLMELAALQIPLLLVFEVLQVGGERDRHQIMGSQESGGSVNFSAVTAAHLYVCLVVRR